MNLHPIHRSRTAAVIISAAMLAVVVPTVTASTAAAATQTITVTAKGFVPMNLSIKVGDTITFSNTDTTVHEVDIGPIVRIEVAVYAALQDA